MIDAQQFDQMWQGHTEIPAVVATGEQGRVMIFAGILLDSASIEGQQHNALLRGMAARHKVNPEKIRAVVEKEIHARENTRALAVPDARKAAIKSLPTLADQAKGGAKKAAPVKKSPVAKSAKKSAPSKKAKGKK